MSPFLRPVTLAFFLAGTSTAALAASLVPHRVAYDLTLENPDPAVYAGIQMKGRMVYEFTGNACNGYRVGFRFVLETSDAEGNAAITDLRNDTFESADGQSFDFSSSTFTNEVQTDEVEGKAIRDGAKVNVTLKVNEDLSFSIDDPVIFPTAQLLKTIDEAGKGTTLFSDNVYDGSDGGQQVFHTSTLIGAERTTPPAEAEKPIGDHRRWPVTVSYFTGVPGGDQPPDYSISFDLWENGVSSKMRLDYGDFALSGNIAHFEYLPVTPCETSGAPATAPATPPTETPAATPAPSKPATKPAPAVPAPATPATTPAPASEPESPANTLPPAPSTEAKPGGPAEAKPAE